jgi:hypothetical protein
MFNQLHGAELFSKIDSYCFGKFSALTERNFRYHWILCMFHVDNFSVLFTTTVQRLDTEVYNHIANLLQVLALFSCLQLCMQRKNATLVNYVMGCAIVEMEKNRCYNCIKMIKK